MNSSPSPVSSIDWGRVGEKFSSESNEATRLS